MKKCVLCGRDFSWHAYGSNKLFSVKRICPDCDYEQEQKRQNGFQFVGSPIKDSTIKQAGD